MILSENIVNNLKRNRRNLHQIPELGFKEYKTQEYLIKELTDLGYTPEKICDTGVYVYVDLGKENTYAFRSDMDALAIEEENDVEWASTHKGCMHACGHDGHMATLLGFAEYLKDEDKSNYNHNILLIFQPAEEGPGGAKNIVESGIFERLNVKAIYGLHLFPKLPEGVVGSKAGGFMAKASEIKIEILGKSGHCGQPHTGIDTIQVGVKVLEAFNLIVAKYLPPFDPSLIAIGKFNGGTAENIIAEKTRLESTIRSFSMESFNKIVTQIQNICKGLELGYGVTINLDIASGYPPVINDKKYYEILKSSFENENEIEFREIDAEMLAEDFSFYQEKVPGVFFFVGVGSSEKGFDKSLHNCRFNFDENSLQVGVKSYALVNSKLNSEN